jgi:hypothetical protein
MGVVTDGRPGRHVFSAPRETISALLANIDHLGGYGLPLPRTYQPGLFTGPREAGRLPRVLAPASAGRPGVTT